MAMRNLIWRLRNRLIVAYLFIAVVPIVLILALMLVTSYALVGQMAVYLVNRELENRDAHARISGGDVDARAGARSADRPDARAAHAAAQLPEFRNARHRRTALSLPAGLQPRRRRPSHGRMPAA